MNHIARAILSPALGLLFSLGAFAQDVPVYTAEPSSDFLMNWLLLGPIPADTDADPTNNAVHLSGFMEDHLGDDAAAQPRVDDTVEIDGAAYTWTLHEGNADAVSLDDALGKQAVVFGYAYCEITAEHDTAAVLAFGSNDGAKVWLNGEKVYDFPEARGLKIDDDLVLVLLEKGTNRLLVKVEERGNAWEFSARMLPLESELGGRGVDVFGIETGPGGIPQLRFLPTHKLLDGLVQQAELALFIDHGDTTPLWTGAWNGKRIMDLPVDPAAYGQYRLDTTFTLAGGTPRTASFPFSAGKPIDYTLFKNGSSDYVILVGKDASESEQWAATELQHWLREAGGAELPIITGSDATGKPALVVGFNDYVKKLLPKRSKRPEALDESFTYENIGANVVLYGGAERGTMYAVFSFLERELGCRWYTPTVSSIPRKSEYTFRALRHRESPGIRVRNDFYYEAFEPIWAARNRVNGAMNLREQPGGVEGYWSVHTFFPLIPPAEFFETHPEYFSLIDGKRVHERAQLCLTNDAVLDLLTERLLQRMRDQPGYLIYSVSQNDWYQPCQCDNCQAIATREESESGPMLHFVNQVAERVEKEFPDKFIGTLAYQYTRKPPKHLKPRENVVIRLCSIECCFAHDFYGCEQNASFVADIEGWSAIAPHLYIWDYVVNFGNYLMPYPNFPVLQPNIQTFRDHKAIGIMEQAAYQSRGGEFAELRAYVIAKLLWDPECDVEAVIDDFIYGYYGRAGQYVREYFDLLHSQVTPDTHITLFMAPDNALYTDAFIHAADALFDKAEAVAENETLLHRVEMARLPVMYLKLALAPADAIRDGTYTRFDTITEREGVTHYSEAGPPQREGFHKWLDKLTERIAAESN